MRISALLAVVLAAACASVVGPAVGRAPPPPAPVPGEPIQFWERDTKTGVGRVIWARNDTTVIVTVTVLTLFDCRNVRPGCGEHTLNVAVRPGATIELLTLRAADERVDAGSFRYKFELMYEWRE